MRNATAVRPDQGRIPYPMHHSYDHHMHTDGWADLRCYASMPRNMTFFAGELSTESWMDGLSRCRTEVPRAASRALPGAVKQGKRLPQNTRLDTLKRTNPSLAPTPCHEAEETNMC
jgi:hypothetical protein